MAAIQINFFSLFGLEREIFLAPVEQPHLAKTTHHSLIMLFLRDEKKDKV
jgi:hypothetical protein